jgi:glutamate-1-semialdehyde aminotransferase/acyl carrier protein
VRVARHLRPEGQLEISATPTTALEDTNMLANSNGSSRLAKLVEDVAATLEETSGVEVAASDVTTSFLDLGLDSLFLTQVALAIQKKFNVKLSFRQLIEEFKSVRELAEYLEGQVVLPELEAAARATPVAAPAVMQAQPVPANTATASQQRLLPPMNVQALPPVPRIEAMAGDALQIVVAQQLRIMEQQILLLESHRGIAAQLGAEPTKSLAAPPQDSTSSFVSSTAEAPPAPNLVVTETEQSNRSSTPNTASDDKGGVADAPKPFGAMTKISLDHADELTPAQRSRLDSFIQRYNAKTAGSKRSTQQNRMHLADPRAVSGFRPLLKELVYPIVVDRSSGSRFWDIDGNEYIDVQCGFGSNLFGWSAPFIIEAIKRQLDRGIEIGPQHPMAGEVAAMFCKLTGAERVAFCNTGSEAVMGALRIARTITGRRLIVSFTGDYHGVFDEVILRGTRKLKSLPAAPGIMASAVENHLVLEYDDPQSLEIIAARATELAAVLVEPVQSRRPDLQPRQFLQDLRRITEQADIPLIFDEVVTGMRIGPGGAQAHFGVKADIATYGKIVGGGLPIGVLAGTKKYMDALDGGYWEFGDASAPTVGVTYFAGTFVRHPAALAAAKAVLTELTEKGPALQEALSAKVENMARRLNTHFDRVGAPLSIKYFGSIWRPVYTTDLPFGELLATYLRDAGIHIRDGFPCFLTTAHSEEDIDRIVAAFKSCVAELQVSAFIPGDSSQGSQTFDAASPPVPGARLGRDRNGNPAWFVADPNHAGKYLQLT